MTNTMDVTAMPRNLAPLSSGPRAMTLRDLGIAALMVAGVVAIMFDAWRDIYRLGKVDEELSYVLLAPIMIIWLAWVRKDSLRNCPVRSTWVGIPILLLGWFVYSYGFVADPVIWR